MRTAALLVALSAAFGRVCSVPSHGSVNRHTPSKISRRPRWWSAKSISSSSSMTGRGDSGEHHHASATKKTPPLPASSAILCSVRGGGMNDGGNGSGGGGTSRGFQVSSYGLQGGRSYMEDEHCVYDGGRFAAVFDGHGGASVSLYLRQNLYANYLQSVASVLAATRQREEERRDDKTQHARSRPSSTTSRKRRRPAVAPPSLSDRVAALRAAVANVDAQVQRVSHWSFQGSTAVVVVLLSHPTDDDEHATTSTTTLVALNVGDSRAVLSRDAVAVPLTVDHKPNAPAERRRVERLGGRVTWCGRTDHVTHEPVPHSGVYRMNGNLALSRAVGDRSERPWVSAHSDVRVLSLQGTTSDSQDEFVVLASDGLWDVMQNQEVVDYIHDRLEEERTVQYTTDDDDDDYSAFGAEHNEDDSIEDVQWSGKTKLDRINLLRNEMEKRRRANMARHVAEEALRRGSTDNVTVVIIWLRHLDEDDDEESVL